MIAIHEYIRAHLYSFLAFESKLPLQEEVGADGKKYANEWADPSIMTRSHEGKPRMCQNMCALYILFLLIFFFTYDCFLSELNFSSSSLSPILYFFCTDGQIQQ